MNASYCNNAGKCLTVRFIAYICSCIRVGCVKTPRYNENIYHDYPTKRLSLPMKSQRQYISCIAESGHPDFKPSLIQRFCQRKKQRDFRLFIFFLSSKEQGNRTGNPKFAEGSFRFLLCIPCPAGL
jgi:hypothetical protein